MSATERNFLNEAWCLYLLNMVHSKATHEEIEALRRSFMSGAFVLRGLMDEHLSETPETEPEEEAFMRSVYDELDEFEELELGYHAQRPADHKDYKAIKLANIHSQLADLLKSNSELTDSELVNICGCINLLAEIYTEHRDRRTINKTLSSTH